MPNLASPPTSRYSSSPRSSRVTNQRKDNPLSIQSILLVYSQASFATQSRHREGAAAIDELSGMTITEDSDVCAVDLKQDNLKEKSDEENDVEWATSSQNIRFPWEAESRMTADTGRCAEA